MTPSKVINRLLHWQPEVFSVTPLVRERCVLATRVGIDVLARFGIAAEPRPVIAGVWNAGYERFRLARERDPNTPVPDDGWSVWAGLPREPGDRPLGPKQWNGHLVVYVPARQLMLDMDFQAFDRPEKGLHVPPAFAALWPSGSQIIARVLTAGIHAGLHAHYRRNDDNTAFRTAPDWTQDRDVLVDAVERAIRKGGPIP